MTMIAYAYLQSRRLAEASGGKRIRQGPPKPRLPAIRRAVLATLARARPIDVHTAGEPSKDTSNNSAKVVLVEQFLASAHGFVAYLTDFGDLTFSGP